jgi:hypothetical protein
MKSQGVKCKVVTRYFRKNLGQWAFWPIEKRRGER